LDIFVQRNDLIFAQGMSVGQGGDFAIIEVGQEIAGIETILLMIYFSNGAGQIAMLSLLQQVRSVQSMRCLRSNVRLICGTGQGCPSCRTQDGQSTYL